MCFPGITEYDKNSSIYMDFIFSNGQDTLQNGSHIIKGRDKDM